MGFQHEIGGAGDYSTRKSQAPHMKEHGSWRGMDCNCFFWLEYECPGGGARDELSPESNPRSPG